LEAQIADAQSEGKEKRAAKLSDLLEELKGRIAKAEGVKPIVHTRKHAAEIAQITKRLKELSALEGSKKVRMMSPLHMTPLPPLE
jgi:glucosamine 6-phosphate synthetase-like amidotransferase/phosphosugar isomerase protein